MRQTEKKQARSGAVILAVECKIYLASIIINIVNCPSKEHPEIYEQYKVAKEINRNDYDEN